MNVLTLDRHKSTEHTRYRYIGEEKSYLPVLDLSFVVVHHNKKIMMNLLRKMCEKVTDSWYGLEESGR
jgi:hypothetical protein